MKASPLVLLFATAACEFGSTATPPPAPTSAYAEAPPNGRRSTPQPYFPSICSVEPELRLWRRIAPNTAEFEERLPKKHSDCIWSVVVRDGQPLVTAHRERRPSLPLGFSLPDGSDRPSIVERGRSGLLLGFAGGRWGGSLTWYSERGVLERTLVDQGVTAVLPAFGHFVALTVADSGRGSAVEVRDEAGRFELGRKIDLYGAPLAGVVGSDGQPLVVTATGMLRLSPELRVLPVLELERWRSHPVSLTLDQSETAYVGMRGVVAVVELSERPATMTWLFPP